MKLHLPLGLLAALLAAAPVAQARTWDFKTFIKEGVDISQYWTLEEGTEWVKLDLRRALGLEKGLTPDQTWVVNFVVKDQQHIITYASTSDTFDDEVDRNDFRATFTPKAVRAGGDQLVASGYGWWLNDLQYSFSGGKVYPSQGYDLVWNPDGLLREDKYGNSNNKVAFFERGKHDSDPMWYVTAGAGSAGPDLSSWSGLDVLWASGGDISDPYHIDWLQVKVSYSYRLEFANEYVVGGAGYLSSGTNGGQDNGGARLYALFSTHHNNPDGKGAETIVADQYYDDDPANRYFDPQKGDVADLYGEDHGTTWNKLRFVASGTKRRVDKPQLPEEPKRPNPKDFEGNEDAYEAAMEDYADSVRRYEAKMKEYNIEYKAYEAGLAGSPTIGNAGVVSADFDMYLGGIVVGENAGDYTLVAPNFTLRAPYESDGSLYQKNLLRERDEDGNLVYRSGYTIDIAEGGTGTFTLRPVGTSTGDDEATDAFINWGSGDATEGTHLLNVASGRTLVLDGKASEGSTAGMDISGGGAVVITDPSSLGYGGTIHITDASTLDLNGNDLALLPPSDPNEDPPPRSIYLSGGNLGRAENLTVEVHVESGSNNLGGLDGAYLKSVSPGLPDPGSEDEAVATKVTGIKAGSTVTLTNGAFSFLVGSSNITGPTTHGAAPAGGSYMLGFNGGNGHLELENNDRVEFYLTDEAVEDIQSGTFNGYLDLWFSNGSFDGLEGMDDIALGEWFQNHFLFKDFRSGVIEFNGVVDIVSGNTSARNGGILRLLVNTGELRNGLGIWLASMYGDARVEQLNDPAHPNHWTQVRVNENMTVSFTDGEDAPLELRLKDLSSGTDGGRGTLSIVDARTSKTGELKVSIDQQDAEVAEWGLGGIDVRNGNITLEKTGSEDLHITGNLKSAGEVKVLAGHLIVDGRESGANILSVSGGDAKMTISGVFDVNTLGDFNETAELEVNGELNVKGVSSPQGGGTISGKGVLRVEGDLALNKNRLNGVAVWLDKKDEEGSGYGKLTVGEDSTVSGLISGEQGVGGTLELDNSNLTIDDSEDSFVWTTFSGSLTGVGSVTVAGEKVDQILHSAGSGSVNLGVQGGSLTLIGQAEARGEDQEASETRRQVATYGQVAVGNGGTLTVQAQDFGKEYAAVTQLNAGQISVSEGGKLEVLYNLAAAADGDLQGSKVDAAISAKTVDWNPEATLVLGTVGSNPFGITNPQDLKDFAIFDQQTTFTGLDDGAKIKVQLEGSFLIFWKDVEVTYKEDRGIVVSGEAQDANVFVNMAGDSSNSLAGADMLWGAARGAMENSTNSDSALLKVATWMVNQPSSNTEETSKALAAVAGSTVPILGTAQREALRSQMLRMRDRTGMMGLNNDYAYESMPFTHFWLEATGDFTNAQDGGSYESGFTYNAWGGTVGLEMDVDETVSVAAGITALYGNLDGGCADTVDGNLDSYYLTLMGRFSKGRWGHTLVGVMGLNQAKMNRTVNFGRDSYRANGSTSGWVAGFMYEVTRDIPLSRESTSVIQPLLGVSIMKTNMGGYNESGVDGQGVGLNVGDQDWVTTTLTVGARYITTVGEETFNRAAQMELRANVAQDFGDSQGEAEVALQSNPALSRTMRAAEIGKTALQLGASLRVPISDQTLLYFNAGSDIRSGLTAWNLGVGARYNF